MENIKKRIEQEAKENDNYDNFTNPEHAELCDKVNLIIEAIDDIQTFMKTITKYII